MQYLISSSIDQSVLESQNDDCFFKCKKQKNISSDWNIFQCPNKKGWCCSQIIGSRSYKILIPLKIKKQLVRTYFNAFIDITESSFNIQKNSTESKIVKNNINDIIVHNSKNIHTNIVSKFQNILASFGKHVIVWCVFQNSIESLCSELRKEGISSKVIYGATEQFEREKILSEFKSENFQILITNPHTLAESVSLHDICHDAIYYEYSYNLVHLLQSKDRIHRLGLPDGQYTQYYYEQCWFTKNGMPFSLDQAIYNRLCEKEQTMLNAIDNNVLEKVTTPEEDVELIFKDLF